MSSCNFPSLTVPQFPDILAVIEALLADIGIHLPSPPSFAFPAPFCPLD